jgi:hypothetical protein
VTEVASTRSRRQEGMADARLECRERLLRLPLGGERAEPVARSVALHLGFVPPGPRAVDPPTSPVLVVHRARAHPEVRKTVVEPVAVAMVDVEQVADLEPMSQRWSSRTLPS